jgi:hypothetical protein
MKKAVALICVLAICGGGVAAYAYLKNPERSACMRVADLCGEKSGGVKELDQCVDEVNQWRKIAGDEAVNNGIKCVDEAKTCGEAMGCVAGAGMKGTQELINDFFKGFGKAAQ